MLWASCGNGAGDGSSNHLKPLFRGSLTNAYALETRDLFKRICDDLSTDDARNIFTNTLDEHRKKRGKRQTKDDRYLNFALWVHVIETHSPKATATKFAGTLGMSIETLTTRIKRIMAMSRKLRL
jgi:hypothetical protein